MLLLAVGVATALVYALWVAWAPLLPGNLFVPLLDLGKITGYTWGSAALYLAIVLVLYALYALGYRAIAARQQGIHLRWVFLGGAVFCLELLWVYPATAADVFGYIADGQLLALHQANPFAVPPNAYPRDAILAYLAFPGEPSQYGPLWALLSGGIAALTQVHLLDEMLAYKLVGAAAHLASGAVIYRIALKLSGEVRRAQVSAYLFVWNPLLLWEMVANAHNDGLMMLLGLIGVWLFVTGRDVLALLAVAAGALVKVPVALIWPTLFVGVLRRSWARAIEGTLLGLALAIVVYRPFWQGPDTLTPLRRTELFTASLGSVMRLALAPGLGMADATTLARTVSLTAFSVVAVVSIVLALRAATDVERLQPAYFTLLAALLLLTTWFQAWYVVWPFALGAALADPRRHLEVALLSLGGLLQYFVFIYLWVLGVFPPVESLGLQAAAYVAIVGPLACAVAVRGLSAGRVRWRRMDAVRA